MNNSGFKVDMSSHTESLAVGFYFRRTITTPMNFREYYISRELIKRGHKVLWFGSTEEDNYKFAENIPLISFKSNKKGKGSHYICPILLAWAMRRRGIRQVWVSGWNERWPKGLYLHILIMKMAGLRIIYDPIDPIFEYSMACNQDLLKGTCRGSKSIKRLMNKVYALCDMIFVVTEELLDLLVKNGVQRSKLQVAWWGSNLDLFANVENCLRKELDLSSKFVVGWLGSMTSFKGIEEILIPLFRKLHFQYEDICVLVGGKGPLEMKFLELKEEIGTNLKLLGEVSYALAPAFTKTLDIYIVPVMSNSSFTQAIRPIKLFDALTCGVPVIVSKTNATMKMADTFPSLFFADNNVDDFFDNILSIREKKHKIKEKVTLSVANATTYSLQNVSKKIVSCLETKFSENS